jgi:hypothetical protein
MGIMAAHMMLMPDKLSDISLRLMAKKPDISIPFCFSLALAEADVWRIMRRRTKGDMLARLTTVGFPEGCSGSKSVQKINDKHNLISEG